MQPPGPPKLLTFLSAEPIDLLGVVVLVTSAAWAWAETARRLREADADLTSRPRFAAASLVAFSAVALVIAFTSRLSTSDGNHTWWTEVLLLLPALGFVLVAVLVRLGRASRWLDFMLERDGRAADNRIAAERRATLAESVRQRLDGPIHALEVTARHVRRHAEPATEAGVALRAIDTEVDHLKEIQQLARTWSPDVPATEPASVEAACVELLSRAEKVLRADVEIRFFGIEDLHLDLPRRHIDTMMWGTFEAAIAAADEHEPIVEVVFRRRAGHLLIEFESNGVGHGEEAAGAHEGVDAARLVVDLHHGTLLPEAPPYGTKLLIRLPARLLVPSPGQRHDVTPHEQSRRQDVGGAVEVSSSS